MGPGPPGDLVDQLTLFEPGGQNLLLTLLLVFKNLSTPLKSIVLQLNLLHDFPYFIFYAPALALVDIKKVVMLKREKMKL